MPSSLQMMAQHKTGIGLLLVVTVVALFVSTCVPMPVSVLHRSRRRTGLAFHSTRAAGVVLAASLWRSNLVVSTESPASGTDLINRLCSRIYQNPPLTSAKTQADVSA